MGHLMGVGGHWVGWPTAWPALATPRTLREVRPRPPFLAKGSTSLAWRTRRALWCSTAWPSASMSRCWSPAAAGQRRQRRKKRQRRISTMRARPQETFARNPTLRTRARGALEGGPGAP
eukprot:4756699-Pyramimonas_sp.AAC.1